jgi:hypothetical protein
MYDAQPAGYAAPASEPLPGHALPAPAAPVQAAAYPEPLPGQVPAAPSTGYVDRFITIRFDHLTGDAVNDPVWVVIRNPRLVPPSVLTADPVALGPDGMPVDQKAAELATYAVLARLIKDWRVYDASVDGISLLPMPASPDLIARLPLEIINRLGAEVSRAANPR